MHACVWSLCSLQEKEGLNNDLTVSEATVVWNYRAHVFGPLPNLLLILLPTLLTLSLAP